MQAAQHKGNDSHTTKAGDADNISVLADLPTYASMEPMVVPDTVFVHNGEDIKNNVSEALVST